MTAASEPSAPPTPLEHTTRPPPTSPPPTSSPPYARPSASVVPPAAETQPQWLLALSCGLGLLLLLSLLALITLSRRYQRQRRALEEEGAASKGHAHSTLSAHSTAGTARGPQRDWATEPRTDPLRRAHIDPSELDVRDVLGSGAFGDVAHGVWRGTPVAVKTLSKHRVSMRTMQAFRSEFELMLTLRHPNIVSASRPPRRPRRTLA